MFYTILFLIVWALQNFPAIAPFNGPLIALLIALVVDVYVNRGLIVRRA